MSELKEETFEQFGQFDQYLTHLDLSLHPDWLEVFVNEDQKALERILSDFGADLTYGYQEETSYARSRRRDLKPYEQVGYGKLIRFKERTDK